VTMADIPYNEVNRSSNGLRSLDKGIADTLGFELDDFLNEIYRVTRSAVIIFCGQQQLSDVVAYFAHKQGTVRQIIWQKSNPSPMNGQHVYLSGIENAVWFKKSGGTFNGRCKNTVFRYPVGRNKLHPTQKPVALLEELIADCTNTGDIVFDPVCGSGSTLEAATNLGRGFIGVEIDPSYHLIALNRMANVMGLTKGGN